MVAPPEELALAPDAAAAPPDGADEVVDVVVGVAVVVVELDAVVVGAAALVATLPVGIVSCGAPAVSEVLDPLLPHATRPTDRATPAMNAAKVVGRRLIRASPASGSERFHPPAAVRAIVEILLSQLVTPVAETKILDCPGQL